jgi:hypothetical protein
MAPQGYLAQIIFDSEDEWRVQQYNDTSPRPFSNNFIPLDWSPILDVNGVPTGQGYAWSTEHSRALDAGETPTTIIAAHTKVRWITPAANTWDFSPSSTRYVVTLAGNNFDLKGGGAYFAVVCNFPDGRRGRYHLLGSRGSPRQLAIGTVGKPATTDQVFPSGSSPDWMCSFGADGVPLADMPTGPSFDIEAFEIVLRGFTGPPTGQLIIREFAIVQDSRLDL